MKETLNLDKTNQFARRRGRGESGCFVLFRAANYIMFLQCFACQLAKVGISSIKKNE